MEEIFHKKIPYHFKTFILDKSDCIMGNANRHLFIIMTTAAKKNITRHWLHSEPPTVKELIDSIEDMYFMEKNHTLT